MHNYMAIYVTARTVKYGTFVLLSTARENCERGFSFEVKFYTKHMLYEVHAILAEFCMRRTKI